MMALKLETLGGRDEINGASAALPSSAAPCDVRLVRLGRVSSGRLASAPFISSRILSIALLLLIAFRSAALAAPANPPHEGKAVETGIISGILLKNGTSPLPGEMVVLEIFREGNLLLAIPKKTGSEGRYEFKNIFQTPEFAYSISSEFEGKTYRTEAVSLKAGEARRALNLIVGSGGKVSAPLAPPGREKEETAGGVHKHEDPNLAQYQLLAVLVSIGAIAYALYRRKK